MDTPICDFVDRYRTSQPLRMHMPGHKGAPLLGPEDRDITEIDGADVLYQPGGIILESERNAASLFGTARTVYSAEGSSLCIRAMLYLAARHAAQNGRKPRIAAGRNAHKVFITAAALLDLDVQWVYGEDDGDLVSCRITPEHLARDLDSLGELPTAVYITSPDYLGNTADIAGIAKVCHSRGILLLVDNAHGAYLRFLPEDIHPITLGADICCDSAHKTLPVLTGGAYLHIAHCAPELFTRDADLALGMFASTSPSYLILQSLDRANRYLDEGFPARLKSACDIWGSFRSALREKGFPLTGSEPLKVTILPKAYGYTGTELAALLQESNIHPEFADADHLVMMLPVDFPETLPGTLLDALSRIPRKAPIAEKPPRVAPGVLLVSPHDAIFRGSETVPVSESAGKIMASASVSCPPAIPIVSLGERITEENVSAMGYYGIETVQVIME